jgi:hypothetical protein
VCVCSRVIWFEVGNKNVAEHKQLTLWKRIKNAMEKCKIKIPSPNNKTEHAIGVHLHQKI